MKLREYTLAEVPEWCTLLPGDHLDGMGGCWGISSGKVAEIGKAHCQTCLHCTHVVADESILVHVEKRD